MSDIPHTVVETAPFLKRAADVWTDEERQGFCGFYCIKQNGRR
jgi:hypothetical protein